MPHRRSQGVDFGELQRLHPSIHPTLLYERIQTSPDQVPVALQSWRVSTSRERGGEASL